eukprot:CAMPEP_0172193086 /NCGR_PEP_ID=MMETSP1050-20130122/24745_1 /TAXON_ID=233186 /ORGANISM="Cryptomonas curvata, Strain CCAP979/52" /LENGTH=203 /DNA_ID=CAMNT_0012868575 /DNA_START=420 /DNA_END=1027 /DNA_ORIENTATION=-
MNGMIVILTGYLANVLPAPFDLIALAASFLAFYLVLQTLDKTIALAVAEFCSNEDESYCRALKGAKLLTTFSWVGVPAVWTLAYSGLISHAAEEVSYEMFDFIIKSGVSCIIMHSSLKTHAEKKEERMRAELAEERGTIKALRETARMKENFFAAMSHELRTPLVGIIGLADGIIAGSCGEVSGQVQERLETMKISGQRLCNL